MAKLRNRNSPKTPKTAKPGAEIHRRPFIGAEEFGGTFRGTDFLEQSMSLTVTFADELLKLPPPVKYDTDGRRAARRTAQGP